MPRRAKHASDPTLESLRESLTELALRFQDLKEIAEICEREFNAVVELLETLEEKEDERKSA